MGTFYSFVRKETRHILRDRQTLTVLLLLPVVMVLLFGFAIRTDVQDVRIVIADPSNDARSAELIRKLYATPSLAPVAVVPTTHNVEAMLRRGDADAALLLPDDFARQFARGNADVMILTDGTNANFAQSIEGYIRAVVQGWQAEISGGQPLIQTTTRMRFNPTLASENLFVPGLLAFVLTLVSALMTAISIAKEKETGTLELLLVSPLKPLQIVVGKVAPYLLLAFINAVTTLVVAWLAFRVPFNGSLLLLLATSLLYVLVALALGVLISTKAPDQRTAMLTTLLGLLMPTLILSGFIFPIASMPGWLQPATNIVPATWFIIIVRGIMLKGIGLALLWKEVLVLVGMAVILLVISARTFPDRIEQ